MGASLPPKEANLFKLIVIKFFHKVGTIPAAVTDAEKLVWGVLEAERPLFSQLHGKSLVEANTLAPFSLRFIEHRAAVAEMIFIMEPNKKNEAINLIEESTNNLVSINGALGSTRNWRLKDCIRVHTLLESTLDDHSAASRWKAQCAEYFSYSSYFDGKHSSVISNSANHQFHVTENGGEISVDNQRAFPVASNGNVEKLEALKNLVIQ